MTLHNFLEMNKKMSDNNSWLWSHKHDLKRAYRTKNKKEVLRLTAIHDKLFNVGRSEEFYEQFDDWP